MRTDDFDYHLPTELIAQHPLAERDGCRLLVLDRAAEKFTHRIFSDLEEILHPGDRLVFNDTKVLPARLFCTTKRGSAVELLLLEPIDGRTWTTLVKPGRRARRGTELHVGGETLEITEIRENGERVVRLRDGETSIERLLEIHGHMPLPPYVKRPDAAADHEQYQTVYARAPGAVAAPTAGLHFTPGLMRRLGEVEIAMSFVTLHVGQGTFSPVKVDDPADHVMHEERFELSAAAAEEILATKNAGGRVIAVGTTVVRILEHCAAESMKMTSGRQDSLLLPANGTTRLKILPPYEFKVVDGLVTNFHLPRSTLLMLTSAFGGHGLVMAAYAEAVEKRYRFFSYGDAMLMI